MGWTSDLYRILDAPPPLTGCVSADQLLLVSRDQMSSMTGTIEGNETIDQHPSLLNNLLRPCEDNLDAGTWNYPCLQFQTWNSSTKREQVNGKKLVSEKTLSDVRKPSLGDKKKCKDLMKSGKDLEGTELNGREINFGDDLWDDDVTYIGLGNVIHGSFRPDVQRKELNTTVISCFGSTEADMTSPPRARRSGDNGTNTAPPSRGRIPPVPPIIVQATVADETERFPGDRTRVDIVPDSKGLIQQSEPDLAVPKLFRI